MKTNNKLSEFAKRTKRTRIYAGWLFAIAGVIVGGAGAVRQDNTLLVAGMTLIIIGGIVAGVEEIIYYIS